MSFTAVELRSAGRSRQPSIKGWNGDAEIFCDIARGNATGEELFGRFYFAVGHLAFAAAGAAQLTGDREASAGALDDELAFHFGQARHNVKEKTARWG